MSHRKITSGMSPFIDKILNELNELRQQMDEMNTRLQQVEGTAGTLPAGQDVSYTDMPAEYGSMQEIQLSISTIAAARRALYGYGMLLDSMGLPKDQREVVRRLEAMVSSMMRLMQTLRMLEAAELAFEAGQGPTGWLYMILTGGSLAASMIYGSRVAGG